MAQAGAIELISGREAPVSGGFQPPHVLLVVDGFPRALGGGERVVLALAAMLPAYGFRVSILTFQIDPESVVVSSPPACPLYLLELGKTTDPRAMRAAWRLGRFLREHEVRIAQTFFESSDLWAGLVVKALSGAKLVWSRRDMGILRGRKHRMAYRLMRSVPDRVFAVSDEVARYTVAVDRVDPERVETVYNGLDVIDSSDVSQREEGKQEVLTVGNIRRVKGHDVLVRAAAMVIRELPGATFSVAGAVLEPEYFRELEALVAALGLGERFRFVGAISNLSLHLAAASVFALPSRSEGFSNAILEAMGAGLPVVATAVGGNAEAVADGTTGWIVPPDDPAALAAVLLRLLRDPVVARTMGLAGQRRLREKFSNDAMMRRIAAAYRAMLRG